ERVATLLDALSQAAPLPPAAAPVYAALATDRAAASDWQGMAESATRARQIDPQLELPAALGLRVSAEGVAQINRGRGREGCAIGLAATGAGLRADISGRAIVRRGDEGVIAAAIAEDPGDWAARFWRLLVNRKRL